MRTSARMAATLWVASGLIVGAHPACAAELVRWAVERDIQTLDPHATADPHTLDILSNTYDSLVALDPDMRLVYRLAEQVDAVAPDTYLFRLRSGVTFQDGRALTADDVVFSLNRARVEGGSLRSLFADIAEVGKIDDLQLFVRLTRPSVNFLFRLARLLIVDEGWTEDNGARLPSRDLRDANGTGPFRVLRWQPREVLQLGSYDRWWGRGDGFREVTVRVIVVLDDQARVKAIASGDVDIGVVDAQAAASLRDAPGVALREVVGARTFFLSLSAAADLPDGGARNLLADQRVRRALALALDRDAVGGAAWQSAWRPSNAAVSPSILAVDGDGAPRFDPAAAAALLRDAGLPDGLRLDIACPTAALPGGLRICEAIVGSLRAAGISAAVTPLDNAAFFKALFDGRLAAAVWSLSPYDGDALTPLADLGATPGGSHGLGRRNVTGFSSDSLDALILEADGAFDPQRREDLIRKGYRLLNDAATYLPVGVPVFLAASRAPIDFRARPDGAVDLRLVSIDGRRVGAAGGDREVAVRRPAAAANGGTSGTGTAGGGSGGQSGGGGAPPAAGGGAGGDGGGPGNEPVSATSLFALGHQFPPANYAAYGIVAFPAHADTTTVARYRMICTAYVSTLTPSAEQVRFGIPVEQQMVTVWPVAAAAIADELNRTPHTPANFAGICAEAVENYHLPTADHAIRDAQRARIDLGTGRGPFLIAWSPSAEKGRKDAIVLVLDMSDVEIVEDANHALVVWKNEIQTNRELWRNGFRKEYVRYWLNRAGALFPVLSNVGSN